MGLASFKELGKQPVTADSIGDGQIELRHLSPELFLEIRNISLHNHSGVKSRKIKLQDTEGYIGRSGFFMYSSDGTKKYLVTIDSGTGAFVLTEV